MTRRAVRTTGGQSDELDDVEVLDDEEPGFESPDEEPLDELLEPPSPEPDEPEESEEPDEPDELVLDELPDEDRLSVL
ncbi:MAG TPA: hypothetical protein VFG94_11800 [Acidimicrobiales bacterium]|nr:hypothetical protein [Acidimicrobiales bacterium]